MTLSSSRKRRSPSAGSRRSRGRQTKYYPRADGKPAPARHSKDRNDRIKLRFLTAYRRLNRCYANLLEARRKKLSGPTRSELSERVALRQVEKALRARDELEDKYACYGVIAEPVIANGFTVDVRFSFGSARAKAQREAEGIYSSAYVPIPLPRGVILDQLKIPDPQ